MSERGLFAPGSVDDEAIVATLAEQAQRATPRADAFDRLTARLDAAPPAPPVRLLPASSRVHWIAAGAAAILLLVLVTIGRPVAAGFVAGVQTVAFPVVSGFQRAVGLPTALPVPSLATVAAPLPGTSMPARDSSVAMPPARTPTPLAVILPMNPATGTPAPATETPATVAAPPAPTSGASVPPADATPIVVVVTAAPAAPVPAGGTGTDAVSGGRATAPPVATPPVTVGASPVPSISVPTTGVRPSATVLPSPATGRNPVTATPKPPGNGTEKKGDDTKDDTEKHDEKKNDSGGNAPGNQGTTHYDAPANGSGKDTKKPK